MHGCSGASLSLQETGVRARRQGLGGWGDQEELGARWPCWLEAPRDAAPTQGKNFFWRVGLSQGGLVSGIQLAVFPAYSSKNKQEGSGAGLGAPWDLVVQPLSSA